MQYIINIIIKKLISLRQFWELTVFRFILQNFVYSKQFTGISNISIFLSLNERHLMLPEYMTEVLSWKMLTKMNRIFWW